MVYYLQKVVEIPRGYLQCIPMIFMFYVLFFGRITVSPYHLSSSSSSSPVFPLAAGTTYYDNGLLDDGYVRPNVHYIIITPLKPYYTPLEIIV
jgi:hypothetical protein